MAEPLNVMFALQSPHGLAFGYVIDMNEREITFQIASVLQVGETMAWRMELKGYEETIMGMLTVRTVTPYRGEAMQTFIGSISSMPEADLEIMRGWMEDQKLGGTSQRVERNPEKYIRDMFADKAGTASEAETKLAIERINERRARREQLFKKKKKGIGGDFGLSTEGGSGGSAHSGVRSAISAALGRGLSSQSGAPAAPSKPASWTESGAKVTIEGRSPPAPPPPQPAPSAVEPAPPQAAPAPPTPAPPRAATAPPQPAPPRAAPGNGRPPRTPRPRRRS